MFQFRSLTASHPLLFACVHKPALCGCIRLYYRNRFHQYHYSHSSFPIRLLLSHERILESSLFSLAPDSWLAGCLPFALSVLYDSAALERRDVRWRADMALPRAHHHLETNSFWAIQLFELISKQDLFTNPRKCTLLYFIIRESCFVHLF